MAQKAKAKKKAKPLKKVKIDTKKNNQSQEVAVEPKRKIGLTLNWNRGIFINKAIDDVLLNELTPTILKMKQESSDPITVGINSPGGNVSAMESLLSLLKCPDQDGKKIEVYTVATNRAYSAAASFLAFGDYSVGFPHSNIFYHDVRYSDIEDVTPSKALDTARQLERSNSRFSLKLAENIRKRFIWVYLDLKPSFKEVRQRFAKFAKKYDKAFVELLPKEQPQIIDVVGFSLALYSKLSRPNDYQIAISALELLASWIQIERIEKKFSEAKEKKKMDPTTGISELISEIKKIDLERSVSPEIPEPTIDTDFDKSTRADVRLLLEVLARRLTIDKDQNISNSWLDKVIEDFSFMKDINDPSHIQAVENMMFQYAGAFFEKSILENVRGAKNKQERNKVLAPFYPQGRFFWYYIVLVCRCLCRGNHFLTPYDAQLLGLLDEVLGGGYIQSKREWRKTQPGYE